MYNQVEPQLFTGLLKQARNDKTVFPNTLDDQGNVNIFERKAGMVSHPM